MPTRAYGVTKSCSVGWLTTRLDVVRVMLPLFLVKARSEWIIGLVLPQWEKRFSFSGPEPIRERDAF